MADTDIYRSHGEKYLQAIRAAEKPDATEGDQENLFRAAREFQEYLLQNISSLANVLALVDEDTLVPEDRAGLGATINEMSILAFDCMEVINRHHANREDGNN